MRVCNESGKRANFHRTALVRSSLQNTPAYTCLSHCTTLQPPVCRASHVTTNKSWPSTICRQHRKPHPVTRVAASRGPEINLSAVAMCHLSSPAVSVRGLLGDVHCFACGTNLSYSKQCYSSSRDCTCVYARVRACTVQMHLSLSTT